MNFEQVLEAHRAGGLLKSAQVGWDQLNDDATRYTFPGDFSLDVTHNPTQQQWAGFGKTLGNIQSDGFKFNLPENVMSKVNYMGQEGFGPAAARNVFGWANKTEAGRNAMTGWVNRQINKPPVTPAYNATRYTGNQPGQAGAGFMDQARGLWGSVPDWAKWGGGGLMAGMMLMNMFNQRRYRDEDDYYDY